MSPGDGSEPDITNIANVQCDPSQLLDYSAHVWDVEGGRGAGGPSAMA